MIQTTAIDAYWRAANYLSVGQIYLRDDPLLREPLRGEHIKARLLGHWGTKPGLNFFYVHLNRVIREQIFPAAYDSVWACRWLLRDLTRVCRQESMQHAHTSTSQNALQDKLDPGVQACIDACVACATECDRCASACIDHGEMAACAKACLDCADMCRLAASSMARGSLSMGAVCRLCAEICALCAAECAKGAADNEACRRCAEACRKCEETCRQMAA